MIEIEHRDGGVIALILQEKRKGVETLFVVEQDTNKAYPVHEQPGDHQVEVVENEGYDVQSEVLDAGTSSVPEDCSFCSSCNLPMFEVDFEWVGSTPTSPACEVQFECGKCGSKKRVHLRRER